MTAPIIPPAVSDYCDQLAADDSSPFAEAFRQTWAERLDERRRP